MHSLAGDKISESGYVSTHSLAGDELSEAGYVSTHSLAGDELARQAMYQHTRLQATS
jgi:hypothetical protein